MRFVALGAIQTALDSDYGDMLIHIRDVSQMDKLEFALSRKQGIGASDTSAACDVAYMTKPTDLAIEKARPALTPEEEEVGMKEAVRKGSDLEPLILSKFGKLHGCEVYKPVHSYRHKQAPYMTMNFDGIIEEDGHLIPVEAKFATAYGGKKNYTIQLADKRELGDTVARTPNLQYSGGPRDRLVAQAKRYGIPKWYYPQVQDQGWFLNAPYMYFTVLFDTGWELAYWKIPRDSEDMAYILACAAKVWNTRTNLMQLS